MKRSVKRVTLLATLAVAAMGVFASASMAAPAASVSLGGPLSAGLSTSIRAAATRTAYTTTYDAGEYYGEVTCTGKFTVSKKYPAGKEVETCVAASGTLAHMVAGKGQTQFENTGGGFVSGWDSDYKKGEFSETVETHEFTYTVAKSLKKFKIIAIY
jgi:hypothetical protein